MEEVGAAVAAVVRVALLAENRVVEPVWAGLDFGRRVAEMFGEDSAEDGDVLGQLLVGVVVECHCLRDVVVKRHGVERIELEL